jgi:hypothetical protein
MCVGSYRNDGSGSLGRTLTVLWQVKWNAVNTASMWCELEMERLATKNQKNSNIPELGANHATSR